MEHKLARICWNDYCWQRPSGRDGKTKNKNSFEFHNGFGHEEWLFDTSKVIDGYHYGFIQAVAASRERLVDTPIRLSLYAIDDRTKQRWWLGAIRKIEIVDVAESRRVYDRYEELGWLEEMREELRAVDVDVGKKGFHKSVTRENFVVLKFKVDDLNLIDEPLEFKYGDPAVTSDYYNLKNFIREPVLIARSDNFIFKPGHNPPTDKKRLVYDSHERDAHNYHNHVQKELFTKLCDKYGESEVGTENNTGAGSRVDLVVRIGKKYALYEIKTAPSLRACVREAMGQLLEYRHLIGHKSISKLVVVSPHEPDDWTENYLEFMRTIHSIPIQYEQCTPTGARI